jgi:hypothetical protein
MALGCALALSGASALAQQQDSGTSLTDKAKQAAQSLEEKAREAAGKTKDKTQGTTAESGPDQMQKQADADLKSAKAQCEPIQQKSRKTLCEKQATAAHANAEVEIQKARIAAEGGSTSAMGAGKSTR